MVNTSHPKGSPDTSDTQVVEQSLSERGLPEDLVPEFLVEVEGEEALSFAKRHNKRTHDVLGAVGSETGATVDVLEEEILEVLESPDRIPLATVRGGWAYNFWTDSENPRGLWRRQKEADYLSGKDNWETLLDVDALAKEEDKSWVWRGATLLRGTFDLALVNLSDGGTDADVTREFSIATKDFVSGGFYRPEGKGTLTYIDRDTCWLTQPMEDRKSSERKLPEPSAPGRSVAGQPVSEQPVSEQPTSGQPISGRPISGQPAPTRGVSASGYPLQARLLKRGQSIDDSKVVFQGDEDAMGVWVHRLTQSGPTRSVIRVNHDFYTQTNYLVAGEESEAESFEAVEIPTPPTGQAMVWKDWVIVWLREPWEREEPTGMESHAAGSLLAFDLKDLLESNGEAPATTLFSPSATEVLEDVTLTENHLVVTTLDNVASKIYRLTPPNKSAPVEGSRLWKTIKIPIPTSPTVPTPATPQSESEGAPSFLTATTRALDPVDSDRLWITTTGYETPTKLWIADLNAPGGPASSRSADPKPTSLQPEGQKPQDPAETFEVTLVREAPSLYDAGDVRVTQHFAVSKDGTNVPYFEVASKATTLPAPTLLYGYGGFMISLAPSYIPTIGRAWINRGGVYVVANIRGGGEFGPDWHAAALKENRHRAYEDFAAVAEDLVERGVTTPSQLGTQGGSNGGLLMGNMYASYPELFGAVVCQVPLLDMGRYHTLLAGHSWVAEYGDPENPEEWELIQTFSPLHLLAQDLDEHADGEAGEGTERQESTASEPSGRSSDGAPDDAPNRLRYPDLFVTTSTKDDRVHPYHARAFTHLLEKRGEKVLYYENIEGGHAGAADNRQRAHNQGLAWAFLWDALGG